MIQVFLKCIYFDNQEIPRFSGAWFETQVDNGLLSTLLHLNSRLLSVASFEPVMCA